MNEEITRLRKEMQAAQDEGDALATQYVGKDMPTADMERAQQRFEFVRTSIKRLEMLEAAEATRKWLGEAETQLPLGNGKPAPQSKATERPGFKNLGEQLQHAIVAKKYPQHTDPRLIPVTEEGKALGLNEAIGSDGGFLVQTDFSRELLTKTYETSDIAGRVRRLPISANSNGLKINALDETSRATGSRWGGIQGFWLVEAGTKTAAKPKFRLIELSLKKWIGLCYATDELLQDAAALEAVIQQGFQEEMRFQLDDALYEGDGVGKPQGFMLSPALVSVAKETGQAAATVVFENIVKMWARLWGPSRRNAVWYYNQALEPQLMAMSLAIGTGGIPVYLPPGGLSQSPYGTLFGRPMIPVEYSSALGTQGDLMLCDPSQYVMIDKGGLQTATSIHVAFLTDETAFRFVYRTDAQGTWNAPLTPFKGIDTLSHIVVLDTRA